MNKFKKSFRMSHICSLCNQAILDEKFVSCDSCGCTFHSSGECAGLNINKICAVQLGKKFDFLCENCRLVIQKAPLLLKKINMLENEVEELKNQMVQLQVYVNGEGFPVSPPPGMSVWNQANKDPSFRAIPPNVQNQASTPHNATAKPIFRTPTVSPSQTDSSPVTHYFQKKFLNMPNWPPQQTLYQRQFVQPQQPIYSRLSNTSSRRRPQNRVPVSCTTLFYPLSTTQPPSVSCNFFPRFTIIIPQRSLNPTPQPTTSNQTQSVGDACSVSPNNLPHQPFQRGPHKRRPKAICAHNRENLVKKQQEHQEMLDQTVVSQKVTEEKIEEKLQEERGTDLDKPEDQPENISCRRDGDERNIKDSGTCSTNEQPFEEPEKIDVWWSTRLLEEADGSTQQSN